MRNKSKKETIVIIGLWALALLAFELGRKSHSLSLLDVATQLENAIYEGNEDIIFLVLAYTLRPIVFFPGSLLGVLWGTLFGFMPGLIVAVIGELYAASIAYGISRFMQRHKPVKQYKKGWRKLLETEGFTGVLSLRLAFLNFDFVSYSAGALKVPYKTFMAASSIGLTIILAVYTSLGASLENIESLSLDSISVNKTQLMISILLILGIVAIRRALNIKKVAKTTR